MDFCGRELLPTGILVEKVMALLWTENAFFSPKRFDRENCNCQGLIVPKAKREGRQDRSQPFRERTLSNGNAVNRGLV
jgi:hypothetical protein